MAGVGGGGSVLSGIYRSTDGGTNWTNTLRAGTGTAVLIDPANGNIAYAAIALGTANGVYKSTDAGLTWTPLTGSGSSVLPATNLGFMAMAIAPSNTSILYVGIANPADGTLLGLFKTVDGGRNWIRLSNAPGYCGDACGDRNVIRVHPANPDVVYAGGRHVGNCLYRSLDGGNTWSEVSKGADGLQVHPDLKALAFSRDGAYIYIWEYFRGGRRRAWAGS